jgi:hypothetical protein
MCRLYSSLRLAFFPCRVTLNAHASTHLAVRVASAV